MTLGDRLEEARKKRGISIAEAAEATKIRGDFLVAMENNSFEVPLPEIYIRGFLRNYARYLHMDVDKAITDYNAVKLGESAEKGPKGEFLGRIDANDAQHAAENLAQSSSDKPPAAEVSSFPLDRNFYVRIGIVFGGVFLVVFAVILGVFFLTRGGDSTDADSLPAAAASSEERDREDASGDGVLRTREIEIRALDDVTVIVNQQADGRRLYAATIAAGETVPLTVRGPITISYSEGSSLVIMEGDRQITMSSSGSPNQETIRFD